MKRFISFIVLFITFFSFCSAETIPDFSQYTDDELILLYDALSACFEDRDLVFRCKLHEGSYTVGSDFPQGLYYVSPVYTAKFSLYSPDGGVNNPRSYNLFPHSCPFLFEFYNGMRLVLESGTITMRTSVDGYTQSYLNMSPSVVRAFNSIEYSFDASGYRDPDYSAFLSYPQLYYDYRTYFYGTITDVAMDVAGMAMFTLTLPTSEQVWVYGLPETRPEEQLHVGDVVLAYGKLSGTHDDPKGANPSKIPSLMIEHIVLQ